MPPVSPCSSIYLYIYLLVSPAFADFILLLPGPRNAGGFSRGKLLERYVAPRGRNPVFLGLVSLPVLRSHPGLCVTVGIVSELAPVLGNSRLFSLSRIVGF